MSELVRYGAYTEEAAALDSAKVAQLGGNSFMDIVPGDNVMRFLPPKVGVSSPFRVTALHYIDPMPGIQNKMVFACPRVELRQPCVVCAEADRLGRSGNSIDRALAIRISSKLRVYACVVDRSVSDIMAALRVYGFGKSVHDSLKSIRKNPRRGGDFTDPTENGFDIIVGRTGSALDTRYEVSADRVNSPLSTSIDEINELIENQYDLNKFVDPTIPEELVEMWTGRARASAQVSKNYASRPMIDQMGRSVVDTTGVDMDDDFGPSR